MTDAQGIKEPMLIDVDGGEDLLAAVKALEERKAQHEAAAARIGAVLDQIRAPQKAKKDKAAKKRERKGLPAAETP